MQLVFDSVIFLRGIGPIPKTSLPCSCPGWFGTSSAYWTPSQQARGSEKRRPLYRGGLPAHDRGGLRTKK